MLGSSTSSFVETCTCVVTSSSWCCKKSRYVASQRHRRPRGRACAEDLVLHMATAYENILEQARKAASQDSMDTTDDSLIGLVTKLPELDRCNRAAPSRCRRAGSSSTRSHADSALQVARACHAERSSPQPSCLPWSHHGSSCPYSPSAACPHGAYRGDKSPRAKPPRGGFSRGCTHRTRGIGPQA
jgi:hypothetical protein